MTKSEEEEELREEALAEWVSRGRAAQDFTMAKMSKLWAEEDGEEEDDDEEALADKQELMTSYQMLGPLVTQASDAARHFSEAAMIQGKKALATAWKYTELPPLRDRRLLRQHVVHVLEMEAETHKYSHLHQRLVDELNDAKQMDKELHFGLKKRNKRQAPLRNRFQELKTEADRVQHTQFQDEMEQRRRERVEQAAHEKQRHNDEKEEKAARLLAQRRQRNETFWHKQFVDARTFAEQQTHEQQRKEEFNRKVDEIKEEMRVVEDEQSVDARSALERLPTRSSIGIFDTAYDPGEWSSATKGGFRTGLDEHTIGISRTRGYIIENEQRRLELLEMQSYVSMLQDKLEQVSQAKTNLGLDLRTILERKDRKLQEIKQIRAEQDALNDELAGPPRRDPSEHEKQQLHTLVTRRAASMKQLGDMDSRLTNIQKRMTIVDRSEAAFRPMLRESENKLTEIQALVDTIEKHRQDLPVVVGKNIFQSQEVPIHPGNDVQVAFSKPFTDPTELLHQVTMESKFEILKKTVAPVDDHYKKVKTQAIEVWKMKELRSLAEQDVDTAQARLVKLRDRFVDLQNSALRSDLVHAIQKYHQDGHKLRQCLFPLKGPIEWWSHQIAKKSMGFSYSVEENAIMLADGETTGKITGSFNLPKRCFYTIQLQINIQRVNPDNPDTEDSQEALQDSHKLTEDWKLYIGPEMDSLHLHTFRDISGKILRTGCLTFEFSGSRLCFSLEIIHRGVSDPKRKIFRYVVSNTARYDERLEDFREEDNQMHLVQKEKHFVSEFVKILRMQAKQTSTQRATELLQELIYVEKSNTQMWDSRLIHGHFQRFKRAEYVNMLRGEIKKEIAVQIDNNIALRQGRVSENEILAVGTPSIIDSSLKGKRKEDSRMNFQARKSALMEPTRLTAQKYLGAYCSFKSHIATTTISDSYRKESFIMGVRYEYRQARTKLHVMHKLCGSSDGTMKTNTQMTTEWYQLSNVNAVFSANSCAKKLRRERQEEAEARVLVVAKDAAIEQLQQETQQKIEEENEAASREAKEDEILSQQEQRELFRREKLLYADAIRLTTYNEAVSTQIDFQVQRKLNQLVRTPDKVAIESIVREVKESFARQFVQGKLALIKKTWERKTKRVTAKRSKARKEREFRIQHEHELMNEVNALNERELAALKAEQDNRAKLELLRIPNFQAAVEQTFQCEHLELKAWGTKYSSGLKCRGCGQEMSQSFDNPDHARGGDCELDEDVRKHRAQIASGIGFRFQNAAHLRRVEHERRRLEKETWSMDEFESMLYDRFDPKSIDDFNYRHGINRGILLDNMESSDPLYPRLIQDLHRASFHDEILFHGRLRNFNFRIQQIFHQLAEYQNRLVIQRVFLENVQRENELVLLKLPLIEADHARAVALVEEDEAAFKCLQEAKARLTRAQKAREVAFYAIEGVEEEAEFAEYHAPALIKNSDEMNAIYQHFQDEFDFVTKQLEAATNRLAKAEAERNKVDGLMNRLYCRTPNSILRTRFGFVKVNYYRIEDNCVVATMLQWEATLFLPMDELLDYEAMYREEETFAMTDEDERGHDFVQLERKLEASERRSMEMEEKEIHEIVAWRTTKERQEDVVTKLICQEELESQLVYEIEGRQVNLKAALKEAAILHKRGRMYSPRVFHKPFTQRFSRLDAKRVAGASEKRLAMAIIEQKILIKEKELREQNKRERDANSVAILSLELVDELLGEEIKTLCQEQVQLGQHEAQELRRTMGNAIVLATDRVSTARHPVIASLLGLDRLWIARKQKFAMLFSTWRQEFIKLQLVRDELARREELRRLAEVERLELETRQKEMLAAERQCRAFYVAEVVFSMQERKAMAQAEMETKEHLRHVELEAMKSKYAKMVDDRSRVNDKAARRLEIKLGKNEQHRLHREWRHMKSEEELALELREKERAQELAQALDRQFDRYLADQLVQGKISSELEASRRADRLREAHSIATEKRRAFELKIRQELVIATVETFFALARAEIEWMDTVERRTFWEQRAPLLEQNLRHMEPELTRIQAERQHVVKDANTKRKYAEKCRTRLQNAEFLLTRANQEMENARLTYKRVHKLNATIDSKVLHDRVQRFRTVYLRDRLHSHYFALLTDSIIRRALVLSSEREIEQLETQVTQLERERVVKSNEVRGLQTKRRRALRMRLRRAELGKFLFGNTQRQVLNEMFQRWTKLWSERTRVRASFKLKHAFLLQKQQLIKTTNSPILKRENLLGEIKAVVTPTRLSILHEHQRRWLQCRLCRQKYSEQQNTRFSCSYHPGTYEFVCIRTCGTRCSAQIGPVAVPASCMMHRAKRWLCCDETEEGRYGSSGCARRFHLPVKNNPELEKLVENKKTQEQTLVDDLNQQLLELRERNVVGKIKSSTKAIVTKMTKDLAQERARAAKFLHT